MSTACGSSYYFSPAAYAPPPPPISCSISVATSGTPINGQDLTFVPYGPSTNTLGPPFNKGWYFAVQIQGILSGDTNPAPKQPRCQAPSRRPPTRRRGSGLPITTPVNIPTRADGPIQSSIIVANQTPGKYDWIDVPGWVLWGVMGSSRALSFSSRLRQS
jgi:hypothetical protein